MRKRFDFYPTTKAASKALFVHHSFSSLSAWEPCHGAGDITQVLKEHFLRVTTSDVDHSRDVDLFADAGCLDVPLETAVITNPPFNQAFRIVSHFAERGNECAFLLRLTFLEPTGGRGAWLEKNPPAKVIVLPRFSFTGDGNTDSVTCAWLLWNVPPKPVIIVGKELFKALEPITKEEKTRRSKIKQLSLKLK